MPWIYCTRQQSGWYDKRWLGWRANNSLTDLHPVNPAAYKRTVVQPLTRLTPALRVLHLDAKKGRDIISTTATTTRETSNSPSSPSGSSSSAEGGAEVHGDLLRQPGGKAQAGVYNGAVTFSDECFEGKEGSTCMTPCSVGAGTGGIRSSGSAVHQQRGVGGCERNIVARWTERQRTMCLIPDLESRTASQ